MELYKFRIIIIIIIITWPTATHNTPLLS